MYVLFSLLSVYCIYLEGREEEERARALIPSSTPQILVVTEAKLCETRNQGFNPSVPPGGQGPSTLTITVGNSAVLITWEQS